MLTTRRNTIVYSMAPHRWTFYKFSSQCILRCYKNTRILFSEKNTYNTSILLTDVAYEVRWNYAPCSLHIFTDLATSIYILQRSSGGRLLVHTTNFTVVATNSLSLLYIPSQFCLSVYYNYLCRKFCAFCLISWTLSRAPRGRKPWPRHWPISQKKDIHDEDEKLRRRVLRIVHFTLSVSSAAWHCEHIGGSSGWGGDSG